MPSSRLYSVPEECPPVPTALVEYLEAIFDMGPPRMNEELDNLRWRSGVCHVISYLRTHHDKQQSDGTMGKVL